MINNFSKIREAVWPLLEAKKNESCELPEFNLNDNTVDLLYEVLKDEHRQEDERFKATESKSIIFIGIIGILLVIMINSLKNLLWIEEPFNSFSWAYAIMFAFMMLYLLRTISFALSALKRRKYGRISFSQLSYLEDEVSIKKEAVCILAKYIQMNKESNNSKINDMTMAQEYFYRAIFLAFLSVFLFIINILYSIYPFWRKYFDLIVDLLS